MTITGIHHVQITVPKGAEDQARQFYCGVLNLPEISKPEALGGRGGLWLQSGTLQVHVGTEDGVLRSATKAHLAYQVEGLAAWKSTYARGRRLDLGKHPNPRL